MPPYDIAISFAGEDRPVAERLAALLATKGVNVFYDEYEKADLWGKDLYSHLSKIYRTEAKYCLMLISEHYAKKQWTNQERRAAQARAIAESTEYILPLRLDDASVDGILDTVGFIDYRKTTEEQIVDLLIQKVREYNKAHGITYELVRVEDVFSKQGIGPKGGRPIRDSDMRDAFGASGHVTAKPSICGSWDAFCPAGTSVGRKSGVNARKVTCLTPGDLPGESPGRERANHPPVSSVAPTAEPEVLCWRTMGVIARARRAVFASKVPNRCALPMLLARCSASAKSIPARYHSRAALTRGFHGKSRY